MHGQYCGTVVPDVRQLTVIALDDKHRSHDDVELTSILCPVAQIPEPARHATSSLTSLLDPGLGPSPVNETAMASSVHAELQSAAAHDVVLEDVQTEKTDVKTTQAVNAQPEAFTQVDALPSELPPRSAAKSVMVTASCTFAMILNVSGLTRIDRK